MPLPINSAAPTILVRRDAYERAAIVRQAIDDRLGLTDDEFRVEGDLVAIGPIYDAEALTSFIDALEAAGLAMFDDFFELSGNWPDWLMLHASTRRD